MRPVAVVLWVALAVCACSDEGARPIRLNMAARTSCGTGSRPSAQDTSCIKSLEIRIVDVDGLLLESQCTPVASKTLDSLWRAEGFTRVLTDVAAKKNVQVQMRAYQARDRQPCGQLRRSDLMLWGGSDLVDLSDPNLEVVSITYECRPDCMCDALDSAECPFELTEGVCSPPAKIACSGSRVCEERQQCFGGELDCLSSRCWAITTGFCADCAVDTDCDSGLCVQNRVRCAPFCGIACPGPGMLQCPDDTSCKRLGSSEFELREDPPQSCP